MGRCEQCRKYIVWGGERLDGIVCCSTACMEEYRQSLIIDALAKEIPQHLVDASLEECYGQNCPRCGRNAAPGFYRSHWSVAVILFSTYGSKEHFCCRTCARLAHLKSLFFTSFAGWWAFPWGPILSTVQISRNFLGILQPGETKSRDEVEQEIRRQLGAAQYLSIQHKIQSQRELDELEEVEQEVEWQT